jgi:hypothetical protein
MNLHQCVVSPLWAEATKARKLGEQQQKKQDLDLGSHCGADPELIFIHSSIFTPGSELVVRLG